MSYKQKAQDLYHMIGQGQLLDAFDKYYHNDVEMQENFDPPRKGKAENRKFEEQWLSNIQEMHGGGVTNITSDEEKGVTMVETWVDSTFKDGNRVKMSEICVQKWEGDQIIKEQFYYNMPG